MKRISLPKQIFFTGVMLLFIFGSLEIGGRLLYYGLKQKPFPCSEYQGAIKRIGASNVDIGKLIKGERNENQEQLGTDAVIVTHPYLGFVIDPKRTRNVSQYGFPGNSDALLFQSSNRFIVGIFGGSFAAETYLTTSRILINTFKRAGKNPVVINAAVFGYKQPQQLFALLYLLTLGIKFDIVINIDGFNEVALPPAENTPKNVFPIYPRSWFYMGAGLKDPQLVFKLSRYLNLNQHRKKSAQLFENAQLYHGLLFCFIWRIIDHFYEKKINHTISELNDFIEKEYAITGPTFEYKNDDEYYNYLASIWKECSLQMNIICKGNGSRYYHFLQPNQYFPGSKPMSAEESRVAINNSHPYRHGALMGYPILRQRGTELSHQGVQFYDLTMIFSDNENILYRDDCCHLNAEGYKILANTISRVILQDIGKSENNN